MADSKFLGHRSCICTVSNKRYYVFSVPLNFCLDWCGLKSNYNKGKSSEWGSRNIRNLAFYGGMLRNPIKLLSVTYYSIFQKKFLDGNLFAEGLFAVRLLFAKKGRDYSDNARKWNSTTRFLNI